jgi:hypothetical protein
MATRGTPDQTNDGPAATSESGPAVRWDTTGGRSVRADVCQVSASQGEIALVFGALGAPAGSQDPLPIDLLSRILLAPAVASAFAVALEATLREHQDRFGRLAMADDRPDLEPPLLLATMPEHAAAARRLLDSVDGLETEYGFERSVKLAAERLLGNRFLVTFSTAMLLEPAAARLLAICERLEMPGSLVQCLLEHFAEAKFVHFGFEENERSCLYKVYLEFWSNWEEELEKRAHAREPFLLHLGLKWDVADGSRQTTTRYTCHPWLSVDQIQHRLAEVYMPPGAQTPLSVTQTMVELAARRIPSEKMLYLDVSEEGSPRRSFDLNLYKAGLRLRDLEGCLAPVFAHYRVPREPLGRLLSQLDKPLGHVSGGLDREGRDFLTLYYGMHGRGGSRRRTPCADPREA